MKRLFLCLLALLLALPLTGLTTQADKESFAGTWYQTDYQGEAWQIELNADGTGRMSNGHQDIPLEWEAHVLAPDMGITIDIKVDYGDGKMEDFDSMYFNNGVLESSDGRKFDRGVPDVMFIQPYPQAKFAPRSAFDGVWEMTGALVTATNPPMAMEFSMEELDLKPPVYIGIRDGRVVTSNQGAGITHDPNVISQYAGNAIYAGRVGLGITAVLYYVAPGVIHVKCAKLIPNEFGIDVTFTMYKTDKEDVPASPEAWENFPWDTDYYGPRQP